MEKQYAQMHDGDWIKIIPDVVTVTIKCGHCGQIHLIELKRKEDSIILKYKEENDDN